MSENNDLLDPNRSDESGSGGPEYPRVGDEEDIAQKRSHQRVQALLDEITNTQIREANDLQNEFTPAQHRSAYHRAVVELWRELQPTLASAANETESYYWYEIDLGSFTIEPPTPLQKPSGRVEAEQRPDLLPGGSWAKPVEYNVTGFDEFSEIDPQIRTRFTVRLDESDITVPELRARIQRADPDHQYHVWDRSGTDFEETFRVDKITLIPKRIIDNGRGALRELAEKADMGFGKPDAIGTEEDESF